MVWTHCGSAFSSIGSLILDGLVQHWRPRGLILDGLVQHWRRYPLPIGFSDRSAPYCTAAKLSICFEVGERANFPSYIVFFSNLVFVFVYKSKLSLGHGLLCPDFQ